MLKSSLFTIVCSLASAFLALFVYRWIEPPREIIIKEQIPAVKANLDETVLRDLKMRTFTSATPTSFTEAAATVRSSVVHVRAVVGSNNYDEESISNGSGVIISSNGYIATNHHVVLNAKRITVRLNTKEEFEAKLLGSDATTDLALLKIEKKGLPFLTFGNSDSLQVGEWVLAVGNPFELESTVTAGIVSAKGRSIDVLEGQDRIESFIQTDAAVNPGNSGGALVNTNGELIGINTAIITRSGRFEGYSFAVPSNLAQKVISDIEEYGIVQRGILGVIIVEMDNAKAKRLKLPKVEGVYVQSVNPGSGADDSGLQAGDVITRINEIETPTMPEVQELIGRLRPGNRVQVTYIRKGQTYNTSVYLKDKNNNALALSSEESNLLFYVGMEVRDLTHPEKQRMDVKGIRVMSIFKGSKAERANMEPGFVIYKVNNKRVYTVREFLSYMAKQKERVVIEGVYEGYPDPFFYAFSMKPDAIGQ